MISGEYVLTFIIDKEEIITVRNILYFGNVYTNDEAIQKRELTFEAGDILEQKSIDVSRSNLYDLDLFQTLSINVDGQDAQRDIIVQMAEQRRKYASLGGGISTDAGLRLTGHGTQKPFGKAQHPCNRSIGLAWDGDSWDLNPNSPIWRSGASDIQHYIRFSNPKFYLETLLREQFQFSISFLRVPL